MHNLPSVSTSNKDEKNILLEFEGYDWIRLDKNEVQLALSCGHYNVCSDSI